MSKTYQPVFTLWALSQTPIEANNFLSFRSSFPIPNENCVR